MDRTKQVIYTVISHTKRIELGLNVMEYCVADTIYHLGNNPRNKMKGWCYASKDTMGKVLGITKQAVFKIIKRLIEKGVVKKDDKTRHLQTTQKWYDSIISEQDIVNKVDSDSKQSLPYSNIDKGSTNTNVLVSGKPEKTFIFKETLERLITSKTEYITIIGCYWKHKDKDFPTKKSYQTAYVRNIKPAKILVGYSDKDLWDTFNYLDKQNFSKWTLETVFKYIPEIKQLKK